MTVLGIDPGIERLGYAFLDFSPPGITARSYGLISTSSKDPKHVRIGQIYSDLHSLMEKHHPDILSVETLIFAKNVKTALTISEVRGVILLLASQFHLPLYEFTPLQVKIALTGYGRSKKYQVEKAVQLILSLPKPPKPDDVSDAIAIAVCGGSSRNDPRSHPAVKR